MKNLTITVDEEVARWARVWAAEQGTSVSKLVGKLLRQRMEEERGYQAAMRRDLGRKPLALKGEGDRYPSRDELYDRPVLRRQ
ncbi:MAG: DUF6364 family protein [Myxococcota bacterium]